MKSIKTNKKLNPSNLATKMKEEIQLIKKLCLQKN